MRLVLALVLAAAVGFFANAAVAPMSSEAQPPNGEPLRAAGEPLAVVETVSVPSLSGSFTLPASDFGEVSEVIYEVPSDKVLVTTELSLTVTDLVGERDKEPSNWTVYVSYAHPDFPSVGSVTEFLLVPESPAQQDSQTAHKSLSLYVPAGYELKIEASPFGGDQGDFDTEFDFDISGYLIASG